jgi:hypothetical protein
VSLASIIGLLRIRREKEKGQSKRQEQQKNTSDLGVLGFCSCTRVDFGDIEWIDCFDCVLECWAFALAMNEDFRRLGF